MAEDPSLRDLLPTSLQSALDRKLTAGEATMMTLSGANGEGLAATDRRVIILREQMPIVGAEHEVDCFDYPYEQIVTARVQDAVGGGHLVLTLVTPPVDDKEVTLFLPPYDLARFESAAARIRMMAEQTRAVPSGAGGLSAPKQTCRACAAAVDADWDHCAECGAALGLRCGYCHATIASGARFCTRCGVTAKSALPPVCAGCGAAFSGSYSYCPHCGQLQGERCGKCGGPVVEGWSHCARCGAEVHPSSLSTRPSAWSAPTQAGRASDSGTAEEHNSKGMGLYNEERYEEAIAEFERALDLDPGNVLYHCNLGVALAESGRDDEALEEYETAIRLAPQDPTAYLNLGYFHSERERPDDAERAWRRVLDVAPDSAEAEEARQNLEHSDEV